MKYKNKKMRPVSALLIAVLMMLAVFLVSCGKKHVDKNDDLLCDDCGKEYSDGPEAEAGDNAPDDDSDDNPDDNLDGNPDNEQGNNTGTNTGNDPNNNPGTDPGTDPGTEPDEPRVVTGYISVTTTTTYCYVDKYSFTAPITGTYTFTIPKELGFITANALRPELDFQLSPSGGTVKLDLTEGAVLNFAVGSTTKAAWNIAWQAVEGEIEIPAEPVYDIFIDANDEDGYTFTYTATQTGNLVVTVTDFAYDWIGDGRFTVAGESAFETGFPRMYALVINGTSFAYHIATVPVVAGDEVTIQLYCHYGYATKANIDVTVNAGSGGSGTNYPAGSSYDVVLDVGDSDGESFTYTATQSGNIVITVPYLSYDYKGDGEYYVADADTLNFGFSKMYALVINGKNVGAYTTTVAVKEGESISIQLYCHHGYSTKATITVAYTSSGGNNNGGSAAPSGTETNPIILGSFPNSITLNSDTEKFIYYKITAQKSGTVTFTWPTADSWYTITELNADGSNTRNSISGYMTESFSFDVTEGTQYVVSLGSWSNPGSVTITITIIEG